MKYDSNKVKNKEICYRPKRVYEALNWLKKNNHLYRDILLKFPKEWNIEDDNLLDLNENFIEIEQSEEDLLVKANLDATNSNIIETDVENDNNITSLDNEVLLFSETIITDHLKDIRTKFGLKNSDTTDYNKNNNITNNYVFVNVYQHYEYYFEKCFPLLYPYGFGGPSDQLNKMIKKRNYSNYFKHVLQNNGGFDGRRFQSNPNFIFVAYSYEFKKRFNNIAFVADKDININETLFNITSTQLDEVIKYLDLNPNGETNLIDSNIINVSNDNKDNNIKNLDIIKKIIKRLSVFSQNLPGSPMNMLNERNKLLSMISSSLISEESCWRFFITLTPKDLYESKLFDIILKEVNSNNEYIEETENLTDNLNLEQRKKLLIKHPALSIRLFKIKQDLIWKYILQGKNNPLGIIKEYWRHMEVLVYFCI